jgi:SnoaL-like domain
VRPGELEIMTLQELIDRGEIAELVSRLGLWLDEKRFDEARSILTEDATAKAPGDRSPASIRWPSKPAGIMSSQPSM